MKLLKKLISLLMFIPIAGYTQTTIKGEDVVTIEDGETINSNEEIKKGLNYEEVIKPKNILKIDPAVKLIAPPISLPNEMYIVPEVNEREDYVPPQPRYNTKKVVKKDKHGHKYGLFAKSGWNFHLKS